MPAVRSEYPVELLDRELGYGIVGIDEHDDPVGSSLYVESARGDRDASRVVAEDLEERQ
jgi:hypothetical protein